MNVSKLSTVCFIIIIVALSACSSEAPTKAKIAESIKKIMPQNFEVINVAELKQVPGLFEVSIKMDKQGVVLYMDKKAEYLFSGSLLHVASKKNLTIETQEKIRR